jgi:hypothetical protein
MNIPTPRTDEFERADCCDLEHALDFARELERECNMLRAACGVQPDEKIPDQEHKYGSILIDRGGSRLRVSPITPELKELEQELTTLKAECAKVGAMHSACINERDKLRHALCTIHEAVNESLKP